MKKAILIAFILLTSIFNEAQAHISDSEHNFSGQGWSDGRICNVCHTPHNADQTVPNAPLWDHALTSATYSLYSSPTMDQTTVQPLGISKLCLSCHDGTVALDSFGDQTGSSYISADANIGTDLSDDHPVSITWTHQTIDTYDFCTICHDNIGEDPAKFPLPFYTYDGGSTYKVECSSCHDPHDNRTGGEPNMLRLSNENSAICLYCHTK